MATPNTPQSALSSVNPISVRNLKENFFVFALYGLVLGICTGTMSDFGLELGVAEKLILEPFSIYTFSVLSIIGAALLLLANLTWAKTAQKMHDSCFVRKIFVPVSNAGLGSGAILMGMMVGLAIGLCWWSSDPRVEAAIRMLLALAGYMLAVIYPLAMLMRSFFDVTKEDEQATNILGILYCIVLGVIFYEIDEEKFYWFLLVVALFAIAFVVAMKYFGRSKKRTISQVSKTRDAQ
jgi:hypothetical protein